MGCTFRKQPKPVYEPPRFGPRQRRPSRTKRRHSQSKPSYVHVTISGQYEHRLDFRRNRDQRHPDVSKMWKDPTARGVLYTDREFFLHIAIEQYRQHKIAWLRPKEFRTNPILFSGKNTTFAIGERIGGHSWFVLMLSILAEKEEFIDKIMPQSNSWNSVAGVFRCNLFDFDKWQKIYIDDCLPVVEVDKLWGSKSASDENEMWVAFLEKGVARLYGSYNVIHNEQMGDVYLALTGGVAERVDLKKQAFDPLVLYYHITLAVKNGEFVSCFVSYQHHRQHGLAGDQYYAVYDTTVVVVGESGRDFHLLKVGNPWGHHKWSGRWCHGSTEWSSVKSGAVKAADEGRGEFWIFLEDFLTYFSHVTICGALPEQLDDGSEQLHYVTYIHGDWYDDKDGGFSKLLHNPRFLFTIPEDVVTSPDGYTPLAIQIIQRTHYTKDDPVIIRSDLFKVLGRIPKALTAELLGESVYTHIAEVQVTSRYRIDPGQYVIIPSTSREQQHREFLLRVFTPFALNSVQELDDDILMRYCNEMKYFENKQTRVLLTYYKCIFGNWVAGVNDGGQIFYKDTFSENPQFSFTIEDRERPVVFHLMQNPCNPYAYAVGIQLFPLRTRAPINMNYIYQYYHDSIETVDGHTVRCLVANDVVVKYILHPGSYVALIFMEKPGTETSYSLVVRSNDDIRLMEHHAYA